MLVFDVDMAVRQNYTKYKYVFITCGDGYTLYNIPPKEEMINSSYQSNRLGDGVYLIDMFHSLWPPVWLKYVSYDKKSVCLPIRSMWLMIRLEGWGRVQVWFQEVW